MSPRFPRLAGGLVCAALTACSPGGALAQTPEDLQRPAGNRYIAIGCLSRQAPQPAGRGASGSTGSTASSGPAVFIITDSRGEIPTLYRLEGDVSELTTHTGHTVQVEGPLSPPPAGATGPNAKAMVLKVTSLVYLSPTCK